MNLFPIAFALILGIYLSPYLPTLTLIIAGMAYTAIYLFRMRRASHSLGYAALCLAFVLGACLYRTAVDPNISCMGEYVTARGVIIEMPYKSYGTNRYVMLCRELEYYGGECESNKKILISSNEDFRCGDSVIAKGKLEEISDDTRSYGFDSRLSYLSRGVLAKIIAYEMLTSDTKYPCYRPGYYVNLLRSKISDLIYSRFEGDTAAALTAALTGHKLGFSDEYNAVLTRTSTRSLFYPAFAHISFLLFAVSLLSGIVTQRKRSFILLALLVLYAVYSSSNPSSVKCAAALFIVIAAKRFTGTGSLLNSLSLYAIISLTVDPMLLFDPAYVISGASTLVLDRLHPLFKTRSRIRRFFARFAVLVVGMLPIYAYLIGHVSVYGYILSVIFVPLSILVMLLSPLLGLSAAAPASLAELIARLQLKLPYVIDALPFSYISLPRPTPLFIAAFYSGLASLWYFSSKRILRCRLTAVLASGLAAVCLISSLSKADRLRLDFIDVGQGDAALVHIPFSGNIIIDGGGGSAYSDYNIGKNVFVPYLASHGATLIQAAFVSHYHKDHCEGIIEALKVFEIKNLFLPDSMPDSEFRAQLESEAMTHNTKIWYVSSPMHVTMDDASIYIYPPEEAVTRSGIENDTSLFIELRYGSFNCLFTGDMTANGERHMVKRGLAEEADVLKVSHHGSATSTAKEFAAAVKPRISLIGVGADNTFGFPKDEVVNRLKESRIYRTDLCGTISIYAGKDDSIIVETEK